MPKVVGANIDEVKYGFFNIDYSVGVRGENHYGDVMLIQALLIYVAPLMHFDGYKDDITTPAEVTGVYNEQTELAILSYQLNYGHTLLKADGIIHPPSYAHRKVKLRGKRVMTMTLLQVQAESVAKMWGHKNAGMGLINLWSDLMPWIRR